MSGQPDWIADNITAGFVPRRREGYHFAADGDRFVVSSPGQGRRLMMDAQAALVWDLIDEARSVGAVSDLLCDAYPAEPARIRADVTSVVDSLVRFGALSPPEHVHPDVILQLKWLGRFGNRMFTYAFGCHCARRFGLTYWMPSRWEGSVLFKPPPDVAVAVLPDHELRQRLIDAETKEEPLAIQKMALDGYNEKTGAGISYVNIENERNYGRKNIGFQSLAMYSPWLFAKYSREELRGYFEFSDEVKSSEIYQRYAARKGSYVAAHLRRDDITGSEYKGAHSVVSLRSYQAAFDKFGVDPSEVEWVTDDRTNSFGINHDRPQSTWIFPEGEQRQPDIFFEFLPDFLKLYFAKTIFRANSAFSWWAACLSDAKVYSPVLSKRQRYADDGEMDCDFVEGNHPHFMGCAEDGSAFGDIRLSDDPAGPP